MSATPWIITRVSEATGKSLEEIATQVVPQALESLEITQNPASLMEPTPPARSQVSGVIWLYVASEYVTPTQAKMQRIRKDDPMEGLRIWADCRVIADPDAQLSVVRIGSRFAIWTALVPPWFAASLPGRISFGPPSRRLAMEIGPLD